MVIDDASAAKERFTIVIDQPSRVRRVLGAVAVLVSGLMAMGDGVKNPGSRRFRVRDCATGQILASINEPIGDDEGAILAALRGDLATMTVSEFVATWADEASDPASPAKSVS